MTACDDDAEDAGWRIGRIAFAASVAVATWLCFSRADRAPFRATIRRYGR